jgi:hypothetical protein
MVIDETGFYNTKMLVPKRDLNTFQKRLLKIGLYGYDLALDKSFMPKKFDKEVIAVGFIVDFNGFIKTIEVKDRFCEEFENEYNSALGEEIDYEVIY